MTHEIIKVTTSKQVEVVTREGKASGSGTREGKASYIP
jgi:hypothetical protein